MASNVEICNTALSHLGIGREIANLTTEASEEAAACRRFFETSRDATLRDFPWPFATKLVALGLITDADDDDHPTTEWDYAYRYPTDCLKVRRILSGTRNDTRQTRVPYKIVQDDQGVVIYTDAENAEIEYTVRAEDPSLYPSDFVLALSWRLAAYIAPRLTGGDPFKLRQQALQMYQYELSRAMATAVNEEQAEEEPDSEFIRTRE